MNSHLHLGVASSCVVKLQKWVNYSQNSSILALNILNIMDDLMMASSDAHLGHNLIKSDVLLRNRNKV